MNVLSNMVYCLDVMVMSSVERSVTRVVVLQKVGWVGLCQCWFLGRSLWLGSLVAQWDR